MHDVRKKIVTDEAFQPVAVQIEYSNWLEIEKLLALKPNGHPTDLNPFAGRLQWGEDALEYQRRVRREWDR